MAETLTDFDPASLGAVEEFDPSSLGASPVEDFDPSSLGAVPETERPLGELSSRVMSSMASGTLQAATMAARVSAKTQLPVVVLDLVNKSLGLPSFSEELITEMEGAAARAPEEYAVDPKFNEGLASALASGAGTIVPTLASGPAAPVTAALMAGEQGLQEAREKGGTPVQQTVSAVGNAATALVTEKLLGLPALLKSVAKAKIPTETFKGLVKSVVGQIGKSFLREGTQETLEQVSSDLIAKYISAYDPERVLFDTKKLATTFIAGGIVGGGIGGLIQTAENVSPEKIAPIQESKDLAKQIDQSLERIAAEPPPLPAVAPEVPPVVSAPSQEVTTPPAPTVQQGEPTPVSGERIVSTGILSEEGVKTGPEWKSSHAEIIKSNPELALDENVDQRKGFIIQDAEGNQRFVGRKEALEVARKSGQVDESLIRSETAEGLISEALIEPKPPTENAVPQRQTEEVLRNVPQQPEGIEGPMPTGEGTEGVPRSGARETQPKIQAEEVANTLQPYFNQAVEAAKKAGATDPESAASQAQIELSQSQTPISNPQALFIEAARRQALKQQERESAGKRGGGKVEEMTEEPSLASGGPTPDQEVVRAETVEIVSRAVQSLPENQRRVMQMTMEERSDKEIASELGMTEASVRKARQNAREALKEKLSSKVDWTGATDDSSLIDDIRSDISAIKAPQKLGIVPEGTQEVQSALDKIIAIGKEALSVGKVSDLRRGILHWVAKIQRSFGEVSEAQKAIKNTVRDPIRRAAITDWIEANGDKEVLSERASASKDPILKKGYEAAQNLTPEELKLAQKIKDVFNTMHTRGVENDVLDSFVDNYVNHIWERKPQRLTYSSKSLRDSFRFSRARVFTTFFEGEQAGFRPKTKDISKLLPVYIHEMNNAIAARQLVRDLSSGTASDGRPLVAPRGIMKTIEEGDSKSYLLIPKVPRDADLSDYKTLDQPALSKWTWRGNDENGNPILVKSDLALHPEAYERLRRALGTSEIRKWYNSEGSHLASIPKAIVKAIDVTQSTIKQTMLGFLSTFHVVQEGTHAIGHKINPFHTPKIDLSNPDQYDAAKHGLMLNPDKISEQFFMEGVGQSGIISKIPGIGRVADAFSNWMFHSYIPGLKYKTYEAILKRNTERLKSEATEEEIKVLSAEQTNAAYGHLNYADLGRDPTMQHLLQLGLLAPDFLEARGRFAAQALKAVAGSKAGREQFAAIALLAAAQFVASQIINKLVDGQFHFDHPFEVRVGDRRYTLRSVPEDIFSLVKDTRRFTYGRINPLTGKGSIQLLTGQNYRGEKVDAKETLAELVAQSIPLTVQAIPGVRKLTETGRNQPVSPLEQFAGSMGLRISRYSPISEVYQLASEWEDKQGVPRDRGSYPVSKYQQLRYALEDQDEEKALKEYKKLRETMTSQKIDSGFRESMNHPFTQSQRMDEKFAKSLSKEDRKKYDLARQKRKEIISRFHRMRKPR